MLEVVFDYEPFESFGGTPPDPEEMFSRFTIPDCEYAKGALKYIDKATYLSPYAFTDRFGYYQEKMHLSTGCKIALLCWLLPDQLIGAYEAGWNARDFIICNCPNGRIAIDNPGTPIDPDASMYGGKFPDCVMMLDEKFYDVDTVNDEVF